MVKSQPNMTKTRKQLQGEQTRHQIMKAASRLFAHHGFHGTSMADLAVETGLTRAAFYHHFESKKALFFAVVQSAEEKWEKAVGEQVIQAACTLDELLIPFASQARLLGEAPTLRLVIMGLTAEMEAANPGLLADLQSVYLGLVESVAATIRDGQNRQQVRRDVDGRLMALNLIGLLHGVSCFGVLTDLGLAPEIVINAAGPVILDRLRPR